MPTDPLTLENVRFRYEDSEWELGGVSCALQQGTMLAIIGPNGSGKSTLLKLAAGVLSPQSGRIVLNGRDMLAFDRADVARHLGYLPQLVNYAFDYFVEEVVGMGRFPHLSGLGFLSRHDAEVVERSMAQTETEAFRGRRLSRLSGGERQRVFLASVLAQEPRVLLLDEPTAALDIHHQAGFFRLLRRLVNDGIAVAVVTHDLNIASFHCDRLLLLARGRPIKEGTPEEIVRAEVLSDVYEEPVLVQRDQRTGKPFVLPVSIEMPDRPGGGQA